MKMNVQRFRVREGMSVDLAALPTFVKPVYKSHKDYRHLLDDHVERLSALQQRHYASNRHAVLLIGR